MKMRFIMGNEKKLSITREKKKIIMRVENTREFLLAEISFFPSHSECKQTPLLPLFFLRLNIKLYRQIAKSCQAW